MRYGISHVAGVMLFACLSAAAIDNGSADEPADDRETSATAVPEYRPRQVLPRPIRPIVRPDVVTVEESGVAENELVIGVVVDGRARAYSINQLTGPRREIINDELGETAIAATW